MFWDSSPSPLATPLASLPTICCPSGRHSHTGCPSGNPSNHNVRLCTRPSCFSVLRGKKRKVSGVLGTRLCYAQIGILSIPNNVMLQSCGWIFGLASMKTYVVDPQNLAVMTFGHVSGTTNIHPFSDIFTKYVCTYVRGGSRSGMSHGISLHILVSKCSKYLMVRAN